MCAIAAPERSRPTPSAAKDASAPWKLRRNRWATIQTPESKCGLWKARSSRLTRCANNAATINTPAAAGRAGRDQPTRYRMKPEQDAWQFLIDHPRMTLRRLGISFRAQDEMNLSLHVVAEDPRYPMLCVNGDLNFGVSINPATGDIEGGRGCICAARSASECICDLLPNATAQTLPPSTPRD